MSVDKSVPKLLATTDMRIVSMCIFRDDLILATEYGVFRLNKETDVFEQIKFAVENA